MNEVASNEYDATEKRLANGRKGAPISVDFLEPTKMNNISSHQNGRTLKFSNIRRLSDGELNNNGIGGTSEVWTLPTAFDRLNTDAAENCSIISGATSVTTVTKKKPPIPDGGFGWVIVFASFSIQLIIDGIAFSFGLIYTDLLDYFKESRTKTSWIGSLFLAVPLLAGPVLSNLVDKYGCRVMTVIGGLVGGIGFALAAVSNSVEMLYMTFGVISGLGIGIGYVTAIVSIAFWFDKKRTLATSLGAAGTGIGTFIYAPITQMLLESYGWRGATLILAGTIFHVCICGCLMRDPDWLIEENRLESRSQSNLTASNSSVCLTDIRKMLQTGTPGETVLDTLMTNVNTEANQLIGSDADKENGFKKYRSEIMLPTYLYSSGVLAEMPSKYRSSRLSLRRKISSELSGDKIFSISSMKTPSIRPRYLASVETLNISEKYSVADSDNSQLSDDNNMKSKGNEKFSSRLSLDEKLFCSQSRESLDFRSKQRGNSLGALLEADAPEEYSRNFNDISIEVPTIDFERQKSSRPRRRHRHQHNNGEIVSNLRRIVPLHHNFQHMRIHRHGMNYRGALLNTHRYRLKASSCPDIYRNSMTTLAKEEEDTWYDNFIDIMKSIFDFSLFLDSKFFIFNLSTLLLFIWFMVPYFYITDHLIKYNYKEEDGANLISVIGIFNTVGMLVLGLIGDRPWINVSKTYAVCLVICGITTALMPLFVFNYVYLMILCMIFGVTFSSSFSFIPVILVELVDLDDFTCAYGLVLLVQGIGLLIGPPMAAVIYEYTYRYDDAFFIAGAFIAVSGALAWVTGVMIDNDEESESDESESESK